MQDGDSMSQISCTTPEAESVRRSYPLRGKGYLTDAMAGVSKFHQVEGSP